VSWSGKSGRLSAPVRTIPSANQESLRALQTRTLEPFEGFGLAAEIIEGRPAMALDGFIFDLDGVLIDSNQAHLEAWSRALLRCDYRVEPDRIFVEIGKGGDQLVANVLGNEAERRRGDELRAAQGEAFAQLARERGLAVAPGARELIEALRGRGLRLVLATSSRAEQVEVVERASGVAWRKLMDEVVSASDVKATKPAPDLVSAAVDRLGFTPAQCAMIGDTPWDARAAAHAGVVLVAVTRGGNDEKVLRRQGARLVYRDPAEVVARLDQMLEEASPGSAQLDREAVDALMDAALEAAREGLRRGAAPIGCVVADGAGILLATGRETAVLAKDRTAHAPLETLRRAAGRIAPGARDTILVSTVEPCAMCTAAAMEMSVDTILYGLPAPGDSGTCRLAPSENPRRRMPRIVGGIKADESRALWR
jgi:HAD superfamily hydrolase (TIGR01509 family)